MIDPERHADYVAGRTERNRLAEAFIRGVEAGAERPDLAGDGDAMYEAFRQWIGDPPKESSLTMHELRRRYDC